METTKDRILEAALAFFAQNGYKGTNLRDLAAGLGITKSALYRHFDSKEAIWNAVIDRMEAYYNARFGSPENLPEAPDSCEGLRELTMKMLDFTLHDRRVILTRQLLLTEQFHDDRARHFATEHFYAGTKEIFTRLFGEMMEKGLLRKEDPELLAFAYTAPITALVHLCDREPEREKEILEKAGAFIGQFIGEYGTETGTVTIRRERPEEYGRTEHLVRESFWNVYRPGCSEHYVLHVLREDPAFIKELDLVMEKDGELIGQNMFMHTVIRGDDGREIPVLTMGPICITPERKRKGYGKMLLDESLRRAAEMGFGAVLFEGNIGFYGKSGFDYAEKFGIRYHDLPEGADASFFLCRELIPGYLRDVTGVYETPKGYYVENGDVEEFDRAFPPKEKKRLPGQLWEE